MERLYLFVGKHLPEILALTSSAIALAIGIYLAFDSDPVWLNRTGSLIIIIGVLLAATRFHEWVAQKVMDSIEKNPKAFSLRALDIYEKQTGAPLSEEDSTKFLSSLKEQYLRKPRDQEWLVTHVNSIVEPAKRRLKLWEIYLVIGGTFLNGFGDYIVSLLKVNGT